MAWATILDYKTGEVKCIQYDDDVYDVEAHLSEHLHDDTHWMCHKKLKLSITPLEE